jgi:hypothetical protein
VDVSDVLMLLTWSVSSGDPPSAEGRLRGDAAPLAFGAVGGDGILDVSDVLLVLRAAVGLIELTWPVRELSLELEPGGAAVAAVVRVGGLPPWVRPLEGVCAAGGVGGLDASGDAAALSCSWDPAGFEGRAEAGVFAHRAPTALPVDGDEAPVVTAEAVDASLNPLAASARLVASD